MFVLNQERERAVNIDLCNVEYLKVRNKTLYVRLKGSEFEEELGNFNNDDQAKAEMYRLIKCLSDGHKMFIVSNPKYIVNLEEN